MTCPECTKKGMIEIEMSHFASYVVATDVIEYEEQCPQCGTRYEGVLVRKEQE